MLLSPRKNGLISLFTEVPGFSVGEGRAGAIAVLRGSCKSLFLLNSGRFSIENGGIS